MFYGAISTSIIFFWASNKSWFFFTDFQHHCRNCGDIFCDKCTHGRIALTTDDNAPQVRVCDRCMVFMVNLFTSSSLQYILLFLIILEIIFLPLP